MASAHIVAAAIAVGAQIYLSPIPEVSTVKALLAYFASNIILAAYLLRASTPLFVLSFVSDFISLNAIFLFTAIGLTLTRRVYFSPLCKFPGPRLAAASKLWAFNEVRLGRQSVTVKELHKKYNSDIIRIGPNELSIRNVDGVEKIFKGRYARGTWYEVGPINGALNLIMTRDSKVHAAGRRIWEKAFVAEEFKNYNPRVEHHVSVLLKVLHKSAGKEVDVSKVIDSLVFDIMADLSFAHDAGMQEGWGDNTYLHFVHKYSGLGAPIATLRNLCQLLIYLPQGADVKAFRDYGDKLVENRQKLGSSRKDIFRHLLAEDTEEKSSFTQAELNANASLIIAAGADTTSSTLTMCLRELAKNERVLRKLQAELDNMEGEITTDSIKKLPYLNGVVNEAGRLFNAVPEGAYAISPSTGLEVAGHQIPPYVQVKVPHMALMTDERYFPRAEEFLPERWTDEDKELASEKRAFIPFGYGVHSCVGKQLALNEMRLVFARVAKEFRIEKGDSWDDEKFKSEWRDFAAVHLGALWVKFVPRG